MYSRNWLKETIAAYLHDSTVTAHLDTWIDMAALRVSQVLQCYEMEGEISRQTNVLPIQEYIPLTSKVRRLLGVQWKSTSGSFINLPSVGRHEAGYYKSDGSPSVYYIEGQKIYPLPFQDSEYIAQVIENVEIPDGDTEDPTLSAYPMIFLNAALSEAYDWKQDPEMMARYEQKWHQEAQQITATYLSERIGDAPAVRAM